MNYTIMDKSYITLFLALAAMGIVTAIMMVTELKILDIINI